MERVENEKKIEGMGLNAVRGIRRNMLDET